MTAPTPAHILTIKHDDESHAFDCHDDCSATLTCAGVTEACRCWWECDTCREAMALMTSDERDDYEDDLHDKQEAHGVEHRHIDYLWMTPSDKCITTSLDHDASEWVTVLPAGDHPVDLDCEEGFVTVRPIEQVRA